MRLRRATLLLLVLSLAAPAAFALRIHRPVSVESVPLNERTGCSGAFIAHTLDHVTTPTSQPVGFYDSNGAGLAINDLDNDGLLDIVLANLAGDNAILWNRGELRFERQALPSATPARGAAVIDVDGDGRLDIVFTQQATPPLFWRNQAGGGFERELLRGVIYIGYAMNWLDADRDGDLDLLTGSYDVENEKILGQTASKAGVIYYENHNGRFRATRIADRSNTLAIWTGISRAGEYEIIIGNDFAVEDKYFTFREGAWQEAAPFDVMPHSTMSYDAADLNNDGAPEVFAVDMKPYADDELTMAQWGPVMDMMMAMPHVEGDPQIMENVLYSFDDAGQPVNIARASKLDGTGWSWSAQFGDLDNDGFQDLYVVNGMISLELFSHLPGNELVEENQVYRNLAGAGFEPMPGWMLNDSASGRGMTMADMDNDGDLDIVVNNLLGPAKLFENRLCGGDSIMVDLRQPGIGNSRGIGARLALYTDAGVYHRDLTAVSGYLSGDSSRFHFGFPAGAALQRLTIHWNDGEYSEVDKLSANMLIRVTRE
ncbi:MAG: CRTAC1 family protein [Chloroflexota bacterium]|nr:CRTAC1 family protein [Chloroflexota bacterium]MDE2948090.1 CRTAC1 family protein [Chloroflexota bacterium]